MINVFLAVKILLVHDPMAYACVITPYTQRLLRMKEYRSSCLSSCTTDLLPQARFHEFRLGKRPADFCTTVLELSNRKHCTFYIFSLVPVSFWNSFSRNQTGDTFNFRSLKIPMCIAKSAAGLLHRGFEVCRDDMLQPHIDRVFELLIFKISSIYVLFFNFLQRRPRPAARLSQFFKRALKKRMFTFAYSIYKHEPLYPKSTITRSPGTGPAIVFCHGKYSIFIYW
jgi:hypothetical protein